MKWEDNWFRKLSPKLKCFWFFIIDQCDNTGVWKPDYELAGFFIGEPVSVDVLTEINDGNERIIVLPSGSYQIVDYKKYKRKGKKQSKSAYPIKYTEEFEQFWHLYPNKNGGKKEAFRVWNKVEAERPPIEDILKAVGFQRAWSQWRKDGGQFIPMPTTWLNQGRWEDKGVEKLQGGEDDSIPKGLRPVPGKYAFLNQRSDGEQNALVPAVPKDEKGALI